MKTMGPVNLRNFSMDRAIIILEYFYTFFYIWFDCAQNNVILLNKIKVNLNTRFKIFEKMLRLTEPLKQG